MSDQIGQNVEASVRERESERERVNESERESKESVIQELRDEIDVLQRRVEEQKLRAQRDALATEVEKGAGGGRRRDAAARNSTSSSTTRALRGGPLWRPAASLVGCMRCQVL